MFGNFWTNPNHKTIEISGFLEPKDIKNLIKDIEYMKTFSKEKEIIFIINCTGGFIGEREPVTGNRINYLLLIENAMKDLKKHGKTITALVPNEAKCFSLATDIYNLANKRIAHETSTFMFHSVQLMVKIAASEKPKFIDEYNKHSIQILKLASKKLYMFLSKRNVLKYEHGVETRIYFSGDELGRRFPEYVNGGVLSEKK